jgi:hypothetical protein
VTSSRKKNIHAEGGRAEGRAELAVEICGVPMRFVMPSRGFAKTLNRRYDRFLTGRRPEVVFDVRRERRLAKRGSTAKVFRQDGLVVLCRQDFIARFDEKTGRGTLSGRFNVHGFDSFLRVFLSCRLARRGGLLVHSAGLSVGGRGFVFPGRTGAGKSTLSMIAGHKRVLADEVVYIGREKGRLVARGTPFMGEFRHGGLNVTLPLAGLFFIRRSRIPGTSAITPSEAMGLLMRDILFFSAEPELCEAVLRTAFDLCTGVPCREFAFRKRADFAEINSMLSFCL